jgi:hypothetical protein
MVLAFLAGAGAYGLVEDRLLADHKAAVETLQRKGLVRKGAHWISATELKLVEGLAGLKTRERVVKDTQRKIDDGLRQNAAAKGQLKKARDEYDQIAALLKSRPLGDAEYSRLASEANRRAVVVNTWLPQVIDLENPNENATFTVAMRDLIAARDGLLLNLLSLRKWHAELETSYEPLHADERVRQALQELGPLHKLGPVKKYDRDMKGLDGAESLVLTNYVPVYRSNGFVQLPAIVNESTSHTFVYAENMEYSTIHEADAKAWGIELKEGSPERILKDEKGQREVRAKEATIPALRLGKHLVENVPVLVLPAEAADVPTHISPTAFQGWDYALVPDQFLFKIGAKSGK